MTNLEILYAVQNVAQILARPLEMAIEQFNHYLHLAQQELFKEFSSGYLTGNGAEVDNRTMLALSPFKNDETMTGTFSGVNGLTCHQYTLSDSVCYVLSAHVVTSDDYPDKITEIDIVTSQEFTARCSNAITYPRTEYPIGFIYGSSPLYLYLLPLESSHPSVTAITLTRPTTPSLVETITNGVRTQHASSVAVQFDSMFHVDIIRKILQYLGVSIGNEFITKVVEQQKNAEQ